MVCFEVDRIATLYDPLFLELYQKGEPYGVGNEEPFFEVRATLRGWRYIGRHSKKHLQLELEDASASLICRWWFHKLENPEATLKIGATICVVGTYDYIDKALKCVTIKGLHHH